MIPITRFIRFISLIIALGGSVLAASPDRESSAKTFSYPLSDYVQQSPGSAGEVLHASASYAPESLDIQIQQGGNLLWEGRLIYDSLVYLDHSGKPTPWLAKSWEISNDGRTYTFHLREDVTFSDGTRFDAKAVQTNFDRIKNLGLKSRLAAAYLGPYVDSKIVSDFTLEVHLKTPFPDFLAYLAQTWLGVISPRQILENPASIATQPVGTGPFVVAQNDPGKRTVFKRREDYTWAPPFLHHTGPAYLESVVLDAVPDEKARAENLLAQQSDLSLEEPLLSAHALRANPNFAVSSRVRSGSPMRSLAFNTARPPFNDVRVRRAVAVAIDRAKVADLIAPGEFLPKTDYLGDITPGYDPSFKSVLAFNPAQANALLDEAGWKERAPDGIRTKEGKRLSAEALTTGGERTPPVSVLEIQKNLRAVGFDLQLVPVSSAQLKIAVRTGNYDAIPGGWWTSTTPDVLFFLYHSSQIARQNTFGQDTARISDPKLDELLQRARETSDEKERVALYREAQRLLTELVPVVTLHEAYHVIAYNRRLHGLIFDTAHNTPLLIGAWLDKVNP